MYFKACKFINIKAMNQLNFQNLTLNIYSKFLKLNLYYNLENYIHFKIQDDNRCNKLKEAEMILVYK